MTHQQLRRSPYLLIAGATLLFYLPVACLRFAIKNDMFTGYFPARFHLSTFLHAGMFPLWDPWINYGIPSYGDITATTWNPLTILLASTVGYNAYTMTAEVLLALFTAGAAMHALCIRLGFEARTALITALCYMASGYFIGDLQHLNWIWGAALLPWCASGFLRYTSSGQWRDLPAALLPFFLFMVSAHPGLMIGAMYFFLLWTVALCLGMDAHESREISWAPMRRAMVLAVSLLVVCMGMAYGYGYNLALTTRAPGGQLHEVSNGAFTITSWISGFFPLATTTRDELFHTDIAIRNGYFGILPLGLIIYAWAFQRNRWTMFWTIVLFFFLFISAEPGINGPVVHWLPLLSHVRLPGEFRVFSIMAALILSASVLHRPFRAFGDKGNRHPALFAVLAALFAIVAAGSITMVISNNESVFKAPWGQGIKTILHRLTFVDALALQSCMQALICFGIWKCFRQASIPVKKIVLLVLIDMTLTAWMNLPYTGVGSRSVADMQALLDRSPKGIPEPDMRSTREITAAYPETDSIVGNWGLYSKQMAWAKKAAYPMTLSTSRAFFPVMSDSLMDEGLAFPARQGSASVSLTHWEPDHFVFDSRSGEQHSLAIKQAWHPRWEAMVDGKPAKMDSAWNGLMAIDIPAGDHRVDLQFHDPLARTAQVFHSAMFLLLLLLAFRYRRKEVHPA